MTTAQLIDFLKRMDPGGILPVRTWIVTGDLYLPVKGVTYNAVDKAVDLAVLAKQVELTQ
jgi:hypothetical protein